MKKEQARKALKLVKAGKIKLNASQKKFLVRKASENKIVDSLIKDSRVFNALTKAGLVYDKKRTKFFMKELDSMSASFDVDLAESNDEKSLMFDWEFSVDIPGFGDTSIKNDTFEENDFSKFKEMIYILRGVKKNHKALGIALTMLSGDF